jgi:hypothetical protein
MDNIRWSVLLLVLGPTAMPLLPPWVQELDEAARRRMPKQLYIPLPCEEARRNMLLRQLGPGGKARGSTASAVEPTGMINATHGYGIVVQVAACI